MKIPDDVQLYQAHGHLLTDKEHAVYELHIRGLSQRAIAYAFDVSRSSVQSRLETGIRRLRLASRNQETAA
jgi:DNA-directed RNA polymerase specialized sigma24 family protein